MIYHLLAVLLLEGDTVGLAAGIAEKDEKHFRGAFRDGGDRVGEVRVVGQELTPVCHHLLCDISHASALSSQLVCRCASSFILSCTELLNTPMLYYWIILTSHILN